MSTTKDPVPRVTVPKVLKRFKVLAFCLSQDAREVGLQSSAAKDIMDICDEIEADLEEPA